MQLEVLAVRKRVGAEHPDTLSTAGYLAQSLWHQGKYDEAEKMEREVLAVQKQVLGVEHQDTLTTAGNLAYSLWRQEKYDEAEKMQREVLAVRQLVLGGFARGNGGDGCMGKVLRVHAHRHQPVLPVVEAQSTLRSSAPRPQLVVAAAGNRAHLGLPKHLLRPQQRLHQPFFGVAQAQPTVGSLAPHRQGLLTPTATQRVDINLHAGPSEEQVGAPPSAPTAV